MLATGCQNLGRLNRKLSEVLSCDNIALLKATVDSNKFTLHCTEMMAWQRNSDNSLTESFVQQINRPAKLDQMLTRFHKLDRPNFHQMENSIAIFKIGQSMK